MSHVMHGEILKINKIFMTVVIDIKQVKYYSYFKMGYK